MPSSERTRTRVGRWIEIALSVYASLVFVLLWLHVAVAVFTDGQLLADSWAWLSGLDFVAAVIVWLALLPVAVFVWAWQAGLEPIWMGLVMLGLVGWTFVAWSGFVRAFFRRGRSSGQSAAN